jgi:hypothetical protein
MVSGAAAHQFPRRPPSRGPFRVGPAAPTTDFPDMSHIESSGAAAQLVSVWQDSEVTGVALAEGADSSGWNLVFQRSKRFTAEDARMGQDTYSITDEAGTTVYGGVARWQIAGSALTVALDEAASAGLGLPGTLAITLAIDPATIAQVSTALGDILAG